MLLKFFPHGMLKKKIYRFVGKKFYFFFKKKFIKIGSVVLVLIGFEKIGEFKKCISSKTTEPILINFFFKESRIFFPTNM